MGPLPKQPVVICPRCRRRMATKEYNPTEPKARKAIKFSDSLVEVAYVCESCGTEIKRTYDKREVKGLLSWRCPYRKSYPAGE
jgi:DNA-directed RNA polymerase subunit RPC12/RpoP